MTGSRQKLPIPLPVLFGGTGGTTSTGTGAVVLATSPSLTTPALGTPSALVGTNITGTASGLTVGSASAVAVGGITGLGTGVGAALAIAVGSAGGPVTNGGALGTPSSGTGTNITGVNAATLGGATFAAPGAIGGGTPAAITGTTIVGTAGTLTTNGTAAVGQLPGTTTNDSAAAGKVGEYLHAELASGSATSLTNNTAKTVISLSLTAGDWDVSGIIALTGDASTLALSYQCGISQTDNTNPTTPGIIDRNEFSWGTTGVAIFAQNRITTTIGPVRMSLSGTTTIYLVANLVFSVSTAVAYGQIRARRVR